MYKPVELRPVDDLPVVYGKWADVIMEFVNGDQQICEVVSETDSTSLQSTLCIALKRMPKGVQDVVKVVRRKNKVYLTKGD